MKTDYTQIPMNDIRDEPKNIAVSFADMHIDLRDTVKLASDIQNYANWYAREVAEAVKSKCLLIVFYNYNLNVAVSHIDLDQFIK